MNNNNLKKINNNKQWLHETASGPDLLCIVFFRGSWCPYDKHYLQLLGKYHIEHMKHDHLQLIAWTSQGIDGANQANTEWELTTKYGYDAVLGDETNALANWYIEDEILPDLVIKTPNEAKVQDVICDASLYPNGIVMPAMVWYAHHGNMVLHWTSKFNETDVHPCGPIRPEPESVWNQVLKRKHALDLGNDVLPSHGTDVKMCTFEEDVSMKK